MDVSTWLVKLGFRQYVSSFVDNNIDYQVLRELTDADLKELGVSSLGHRKKILDSIHSLNQQQSVTSTKTPTKGEAERRQITVVFCDLVGSTQLSTKHDPEDLHEVISSFLDCCSELVAKSDGHIARYMGDGVLIYFGWPQAHENDAENAIQLSLELIEATKELRTLDDQPLAARVGIATGLVVVGELIGEGTSQEETVTGETPNLAARLQALASPNSIVISSNTRKLVGGHFEYRELGPVSLKGFEELQDVYEVLRSSKVLSRFDALHETALIPLVGREEEIEILQRRWDKATSGEGQVVLISGEPGIGKSRITESIKNKLAHQISICLRYFCSPNHVNSALYPVIAHFERWASFEYDDNHEVKVKKLESVIDTLATPADDLRLFREMLSLAEAEGFPQASVTPQRKKEMTMEALLKQLQRAAQETPLLIIFEDVHWIDPTSLELLDLIVQSIQSFPVMLLITFRSEFQPPWTGQAHVTTMALKRLSREDGETLVESISGEKGLSTEIIAKITERADGIPLFVEELTKAVVEAEAGTGTGHPDRKQDASGSSQEVPASLHASLISRIDRLGAIAKELLQIGAAIGRTFSYELLSAIAQRSDSELQVTLDKLVESGIVFCRGIPPQATYLFKHALVQDACYGTMLRSRRPKLHEHIVKVLLELFPEFSEQNPELLAYHFTKAGLLEEAVKYWRIAGQKSISMSAMTEAVEQIRKGLEILPNLDDGANHLHIELDLQRNLGAALVASKGNSASETGEAFLRAKNLSESLGDYSEIVSVLSGLSIYYQSRSDFASLYDIGEQLMNLVKKTDDNECLLLAHRSMGLYQLHKGRFKKSKDHFENILEIADTGSYKFAADTAGYDNKAVALTYSSFDLTFLGHFENAITRIGDAVKYCRELDHSHNLAYSLNYAALLHLLMRNHSDAAIYLKELTRIANKNLFPDWQALANIKNGYLLIEQGQTVYGLALARDGMSIRDSIGALWHQTCYLDLLAICCEKAGELTEASDLVDSALELADRIDEQWYVPELYRHKGELLLKQSSENRSKAKEQLLKALKLAKEQEAKFWELRVSTSLAELHRGLGDFDEARRLLKPICNWFDRRFDLPDLVEARNLIDL